MSHVGQKNWCNTQNECQKYFAHDKILVYFYVLHKSLDFHVSMSHDMPLKCLMPLCKLYALTRTHESRHAGIQ